VPGLTFHPSSDWLTSHGYNTGNARCIEIGNLENFLAVSSHRYESVRYIRGGKLRAYALNNAAEYFAELSEAYFGKNDFYPFVRGELEEFDHAGFQMIEKLWIVR